MPSELHGATEAWATTGARYNDLVRLGGNITKALEEVDVAQPLLDSPDELPDSSA